MCYSDRPTISIFSRRQTTQRRPRATIIRTFGHATTKIWAATLWESFMEYPAIDHCHRLRKLSLGDGDRPDQPTGKHPRHAAHKQQQSHNRPFMDPDWTAPERKLELVCSRAASNTASGAGTVSRQPIHASSLIGRYGSSAFKHVLSSRSYGLR